MASPDERSRPQAKDSHTHKDRSRSACHFKDSPYFEKFLFFEKRPSNMVDAVPTLAVKMREKSLSSSSINMKYAANIHVSARTTSAARISEKRLQASLTDLRDEDDKTIGTRSQVKELHSSTVLQNTASIRDHAYSPAHTAIKNHASSTAHNPMRGHASRIYIPKLQNDPESASPAQHNLSQHNQGMTRTRSSSSLISLKGLENTENASKNFLSKEPAVNKPTNSHRRYSTAEISKLNFTHTSAPICGKNSVSLLSILPSCTEPANISGTSNSHLYSHANHSLCDISTTPLHEDVNYWPIYSGHDPKLGLTLNSELQNQSCKSDPCAELPSENFLSCTTSAGAGSECVSEEDDSSSRNMSTKTSYTATRKISTASINLTNVHKTPESSDKHRKIRVIKANNSIPNMAVQPSVRLDEWLSAVMKLQIERGQTEPGIFFEDEPAASRFHVTSQSPGSLNADQVKVFNSSVDPTSSKNDLYGVQSVRRRWSSTGTNTDISCGTDNVYTPLDISNTPYLMLSTQNSKTSTKEHHIESLNSCARSSTYCSACCIFHRNQHCCFGPQFTDNVRIHESSTSPEKSPQSGALKDNKMTASIPIHVSTHQKSDTSSLTISSRQDEKAARDVKLKTRNSSADILNSKIIIHVTGEDTNLADCSSEQVRDDIFGNTDLPACETIVEGHGNRNNLIERVTVVRGITPHYMFPRRNSGLDDDDLFQDRLSHRSSVGSITSNVSACSYISSNADSAVDLGPPDDDHEFECTDYITRYHVRRFSVPNASIAVSEQRVNEDVKMLESLVTASFNVNNLRVFQPSTQSVHIDSTISHLPITLGNIKQEFTGDSSESSIHTILKPHDQGRHKSVPLGSRDNILQSRELLMSALDNLKIIPTSSDPYKARPAANELTNGNFLEDSCAPDLQKVSSTTEGEPFTMLEHISPSGNNIGRQILEQRNCQLQDEQQTREEQFQRSHPNIPELIISDHSDRPRNQDNTTLESVLGKSDRDNESPCLSRSASNMSFSEVDLLDTKSTGMLRTGSESSLCSITSTCSTCTPLSDSDTDVQPRKGPISEAKNSNTVTYHVCRKGRLKRFDCLANMQSSWRKIRSFILWSPFIQVFKKHRYPWIQLAGHQGNFHAGEAGSVLKKLDPREQACFQKLMTDTLKDFVPEYRGDVDKNGDTYIQLQDLLGSFSHPCVMDVKMGVRTYLEDELQKARKSPSLRKDMYQKMIEVDCSAPTTEEHELKAVSKPRYMQWRDEMSSSVELGFRVEGIKKSDGNSSKDFKKTKSRDSVVDIMKSYIGDNENIAAKYVRRLKDLMATQEASEFFMSHEVIGSSLLFVHDADDNVGVWMIDFGKSEPLPVGVKIDHRSSWDEGNHEDGYLFGLDNLISIFEEVQRSLMSSAV